MVSKARQLANMDRYDNYAYEDHDMSSSPSLCTPSFLHIKPNYHPTHHAYHAGGGKAPNGTAAGAPSGAPTSKANHYHTICSQQAQSKSSSGGKIAKKEEKKEIGRLRSKLLAILIFY